MDSGIVTLYKSKVDQCKLNLNLHAYSIVQTFNALAAAD